MLCGDYKKPLSGSLLNKKDSMESKSFFLVAYFVKGGLPFG